MFKAWGQGTCVNYESFQSFHWNTIHSSQHMSPLEFLIYRCIKTLHLFQIWCWSSLVNVVFAKWGVFDRFQLLFVVSSGFSRKQEPAPPCSFFQKLFNVFGLYILSSIVVRHLPWRFHLFKADGYLLGSISRAVHASTTQSVILGIPSIYRKVPCVYPLTKRINIRLKKVVWI